MIIDRDEIIKDIMENASDTDLLDWLTDMRDDVEDEARRSLEDYDDETLKDAYVEAMGYEYESDDKDDEDVS